MWYMCTVKCLNEDDDHLKDDISMIHYPFGHWPLVSSIWTITCSLRTELTDWQISGVPWRDGVCHRGRRAVCAHRHQQERRVQGSLQPQRLVKQSQEGSLDLFFFLTSGDKSPKGKAQSKKETSGQKYQNVLWVQPSLFILTNYLCKLTFIIPLQLHKHNII